MNTEDLLEKFYNESLDDLKYSSKLLNEIYWNLKGHFINNFMIHYAKPKVPFPNKKMKELEKHLLKSYKLMDEMQDDIIKLKGD